MSQRTRDLRRYATAYDARDELPNLAWMDDDSLKLLTIWQGTRFERGRVYFDLDNPDRGPFAASGDEAPPADYTYVRQDEVPVEVWTKLITWAQPVDESQADSIQAEAETLGTPDRVSASGASSAE